jgi:1,4-dihydroxy-2-naphthoate polyprenyltransferase
VRSGPHDIRPHGARPPENRKVKNNLRPARRPGPVQTWLIAVRPVSFTASVVPVLVGTAVAADETFRPWLFALALVGSVGVLAGTNLVNDYYDHVKGTDTEDSPGPPGVIQRGLLEPRAVLTGGIVAFAVSAAVGIAITVAVGWPILLLGVASVAAGYSYTAPPLSLAYRGLGEAVVFVFMAPVIVVGAYYVQTEAWAWEPFLASLPVALLVAAILHANNLRDLDSDRERGKRTLATITGRRVAVYEYDTLVLLPYVLLVALVLADAAPWPVLLTLVTLPIAGALAAQAARERRPRALNALLAGTAGLHMLFGLLLALGYALRAWTGMA